MKEISGNFIDLDAEEEDARCPALRNRRVPLRRRYSKPRIRRRAPSRNHLTGKN